jgi:tetratricopeptide (TPR) repeat protein
MMRPATRKATLGILFILTASAFAQPVAAPKQDKAQAYYNFAMGHLYAELAAAYGNRGEYLNKAIDHYKLALQHDPDSSLLFEELTELYVQAGKVRDAVSEAEQLIRQNPSNITARRILGRIYSRMIGDTQQGRVNEDMLRMAKEQYEKIVGIDPKDLDSWLTLGRLYRVPPRNSLEAEKAYKTALELDTNNEEALTGLAILYSDIGDTKKAIEMLSIVTTRNPNARTLAALASSYEQMRDYASAADVLKKAVELAPDNTRLKSALAQNLLFADRDDEALALYEEIAREDPKDVQAHLRISEIYRQKREFAKAHAALAKAKELDRDSMEVRYDEINLLEAEGKNEQALTLLKGLLGDTSKSTYTNSEKNNRAMLLERLGMLHRSLGQFPLAVETFRQIGDLNPEFAPRVAVHVIDSYRLAKDFTKARQESEAALKKFPEERLVKLAHASLLSELGQIDEAAAVVSTLLKGGKDRETQLALAQVYEKGKRYAEVEKALKAAEEASQNDAERETVYFMRGAMYERMKRYDDAETAFRKVLENNPKNPSALNYLGYMLADRGVRLDEAHELISKALELDPNNGAYLDSLGWVYYRQNKLQEAETYLRRSLDLIKNDPTVHDHLGDVYFKQGRVRDAINQWQISLKQWETNPPADVDKAEMAKISKKLENARVRLARENSSQQP